MKEDMTCFKCIIEMNQRHFLEFEFLLGKSEFLTNIPEYDNLYNENIEDMVYIARIFKDNLMRINSLEDHVN